MTRYAPPAAKIAEALRLDLATARKIREAWKATTDHGLAEIVGWPLIGEIEAPFYSPATLAGLRRAVVDRLGDFSGVEYLGHHKNLGRSVYYCNAGDTYAPTLYFIGPHMRLGCWGDLVERGQIEEGAQL